MESDDWYHPGLMTPSEILDALIGPPEKRRIPYTPDDPRPLDQRPYINQQEDPT